MDCCCRIWWWASARSCCFPSHAKQTLQPHLQALDGKLHLQCCDVSNMIQLPFPVTMLTHVILAIAHWTWHPIGVAAWVHSKHLIFSSPSTQTAQATENSCLVSLPIIAMLASTRSDSLLTWSHNYPAFYSQPFIACTIVWQWCRMLWSHLLILLILGWERLVSLVFEGDKSNSNTFSEGLWSKLCKDLESRRSSSQSNSQHLRLMPASWTISWRWKPHLQMS